MLSVLAGIVAGVFSSLSLVAPLLLSPDANIGKGLGGALGSFLCISVLIIAVRAFWPQSFLTFAISCILTFLVCAVAAVLVHNKRQ